MKKIVLALLLGFSSLLYSQTKTYQLSSHILDVSEGIGAQDVKVALSKQNPKTLNWEVIDEKITDSNGRIKEFLPQEKDNKGIYKLTFYTEDYFTRNKKSTFYPFVEVVFEIKDNQHYHVPITLTAYGYSTYRGN